MGKKHKKHHRSDWKLEQKEEQRKLTSNTQSESQEKMPLKLVFKIRSNAEESTTSMNSQPSSSEHHSERKKKKKKSSHHHKERDHYYKEEQLSVYQVDPQAQLPNSEDFTRKSSTETEQQQSYKGQPVVPKKVIHMQAYHQHQDLPPIPKQIIQLHPKVQRPPQMTVPKQVIQIKHDSQPTVPKTIIQLQPAQQKYPQTVPKQTVELEPEPQPTVPKQIIQLKPPHQEQTEHNEEKQQPERISAPVVPAQGLSKEQQEAVSVLWESLLKELERKDPQNIFAWPVNDTIAPGYSQMIKYPMDFSTMRSKVEAGGYQHIDQFRFDFDAMIDNCKRYNKEDTIYHKAAKKLKYSARKILGQERLIGLRRALKPLLESFTAAEYYALLGVPLPDHLPNDDNEQQVAAFDRVASERADDAAVAGEEPSEAGDAQVSYTDFDSIRTVAPDSRLAAKSARERLALKRPHDRLVALRVPDSDQRERWRVEDIELDCLTPVPHSHTGAKRFKLSELYPATGNATKPSRVAPADYLGYGAFGAPAPTYGGGRGDRAATETYGGETGALFAASMQDFVRDAHPALSTYVDDLLNHLTHGVHRRGTTRSKNESGGNDADELASSSTNPA